MAPPKNKEKIIYINIGFTESIYKNIKKATRLKKSKNPTEFCRQTVCESVELALDAA